MDLIPLKTPPSDPKELEFPSINRLLYDWVSLSFRGMSVESMIDFLGLRDCPWEIMTSGNGYTHRHFFNQISISFSEDLSHVNGFLLLEMSGQGCRAFESYGTGDFDSLFRLVRSELNKHPNDPASRDFRLTRLDVAFDDVVGILDINTICDYTRQEYFTCRMKTYEVIYGSKGNSTTFGRKGSNVFIRIYDKARERGFSDGRHWIRCEMQLRSDAAVGFCSQLSDAEPWGLYSGVLSHYLLFREPSDDSNKSRWDVAPWWDNFLEEAKAVSVLSRPGVLYNLSKAEKYVFSQPLGSIWVLLKSYGARGFLKMLREQPLPKNPKYQRLLAEIQADQDRQRKYVEVDLGSSDILDDLDASSIFGSSDPDNDYAYSEYGFNRMKIKKQFGFHKSEEKVTTVTCRFCGKTDSTDMFWTYTFADRMGECQECKDKKTDSFLAKVNGQASPGSR